MDIPIKLNVSPASSTLAFGDALQLTPVLTDQFNNVCEATQPFTYQSSNTVLLSVNSDGLCTAASGNPDVLQTGGQITIAVTYPWGGSSGTIYANAVITVTAPAALTVLVPQSPNVTPEEAQTFISGIANGYGWKAVPSSLIEE